MEAGGTKLGENFSLETSNQACFQRFLKSWKLKVNKSQALSREMQK